MVSYLWGDLGQALFITWCHEDVIFTRKSHNCIGTAFVLGDSVGGSKMTEQTLQKLKFDVRRGVAERGKNEKEEKTVLHNFILYQYRMLQIT